MATIGTLTAMLRIDTKGLAASVQEFQRATGTIQRNAGTINTNLRNLSRPIADISKKFLLLSTAAAAAGVAMVGFAVKTAASVEESMGGLAKVFKGTDAELNKLKDSAIKLAIEFGASIQDVISGMAEFSQAGVDVTDSLRVQNDAMTAAKVSLLSVAEASQFLVRVIKGVGLEWKDTGRIVDKTNAIQNKFATSQRDLFEALAVSGGAAQAYGVELDDLMASLVPIIEVFQSGAIAGVAMRVILQRLFKDIGTGKNEFENLGVRLADAEGNLRNIKDVVHDLVTLWPNLTQVQQTQALSTQLGARGLDKFSRILGKENTMLEVYKTSINSAGSATRELAKAMSTTTHKYKQARTAISALQLEIGENLNPTFGSLFAKIREAIEALTSFEKENKILGTIISNIFKPVINDIIKGLDVLKKNITTIFAKVDISPLTNSFEKLTKTLRTLFNINLSSPEGWITLFNTIINVVAGAVLIFEGMLRIGRLVGKWLFKLITAFNKLSPTIKTALGVGGALAIAITIISPFIAAVTSMIAIIGVAGGGAGLIAALGSVIAFLLGPVGITVALTTVTALIIKQVSELETAKAAWNTFGNFLSDVAYRVMNPFAKTSRLEKLKEDLAKSVETEKRFLAKSIEIEKRLAIRTPPQGAKPLPKEKEDIVTTAQKAAEGHAVTTRRTVNKNILRKGFEETSRVIGETIALEQDAAQQKIAILKHQFGKNEIGLKRRLEQERDAAQTSIIGQSELQNEIVALTRGRTDKIIALEQSFNQQQEALRNAALEAEMGLLSEGTAAFLAHHQARQEILATQNEFILAANTTLADQIMVTFADVSVNAIGMFSQALDDVIMRSGDLAEAIVNIGKSMASMIIQTVSQWLIMAAIGKAIALLGVKTQTAVGASVASVWTPAAFMRTIAEAGPFKGPAMFAAFIAAVPGLQAAVAASAVAGGTAVPLAEGGLTTGEGLAFLHRDEIVEPTNKLQKLLDKVVGKSSGRGVMFSDGAIQITITGSPAEEITEEAMADAVGEGIRGALSGL